VLILLCIVRDDLCLILKCIDELYSCHVENELNNLLITNIIN